MANQQVLSAETITDGAPAVNASAGFKICPVDFKFQRSSPAFHRALSAKASHAVQAVQPVQAQVTEAPLGILDHFQGSFAGNGFNTIFRPQSGQTNFPTMPVNLHGFSVPDDNVLELNLTSETLEFSGSLGDVPNRGSAPQTDITLNGVPYLQKISDISNPSTGGIDGPAVPIHFEPGLWMHVPGTTLNPTEGPTLSRMASIPHGTTINAQGVAPTDANAVAGPPDIPAINITPFIINNPTSLINFPSQTASFPDVPRIPQDLTQFIAAGTITQEMLDNPNAFLRHSNEGKNIVKSVTFTVSTVRNAQSGGDTIANIDFLEGQTNKGPNADAQQVTAQFWISTLEHTLEVPRWQPGQPDIVISPGNFPQVKFIIKPVTAITEPKTITVHSTQIQYSQMVLLNFVGLSWPHASVATLHQSSPIQVDASLLASG
ncbi:hypothetical protein BT63DRAFT_374243 [Microthyrium microscopicum]|uniref:Uncharacterized protein n=1 Tax=Microthyrium microscopicum TaxID=703497 RepID=A0A6A6UCA6_9PEZI|nr:hypothetical protein BT63DRAFT_374243 [Microthyrium microscopicum]